MKKVSVIIPIYNVEDYLERCLLSIINQTYKNIQIILVNDGSTDQSGQICTRFSEKDARITVIQKQNGGLSDARNYGLKAALGDYVTFIDSDDYVSKDYIEYLVSILEKKNADISVVGYKHFKGDTCDIEEDVKEQLYCYNSKNALEDLLYQKRISTSAWAKLYRRELFNDIWFPKGKLYEDVNTIYKLFFKAKLIVWSSSQKYYYCIRKNSIVHSKFNPRKIDYVDNCREVADFIAEVYPELSTAAKSRYLWANIHVWVNIDRPDQYADIYNTVEMNIKKYRGTVLKDSKVPLKIRMTVFLTYFGWRISRGVYLLSKGI